MPAWPILNQLQMHYELLKLVGPPLCMADPCFHAWWPAHDGAAQESHEESLLVMDAFFPEQQASLLTTISNTNRLVVLADTANLTSSEIEALDNMANTYCVLPPVKENKRLIKQPQVYKKGFWSSGSKKMCKCKTGGLQVWVSGYVDFPSIRTPVSLPPVSYADGQGTN
eukprot:1368270-Rhodomonas_salina.1